MARRLLNYPHNPGDHSIRKPYSILAIAVVCLSSASPALASNGVTIPEPTDIALFAMGVMGLVIGRYGAKKRPRD